MVRPELLTVALASFLAAPSLAAPPLPSWKAIDALVADQKMQAALEATQERLEAAKARKDEEDWTRALVRVTQLQHSLHGYETAVRFLRETPWPRGVVPRAVLNLFYAQSLVTYGNVYGHELRGRERVASQGPVDLKRWTLEQLHAEAQRALGEIWQARAALGRVPVSKASEYLEPNSYPRDIRGTLRDAVTYLRVQFLADTSGWTPEQSNEVYRLKLAALLSADARSTASVDLSDPSVHPLWRLVAALADLEGWHAGKGEREAALEASLERMRRLWASFTEEEDRARLLVALDARLRRDRAVRWFSMGKALGAEWVQASGDLVKARALAEEGRKAYPTSAGGRRCAHLVAAIEQPGFQLRGMFTDGLGRRSIELSHRNLPVVHFRAYRMDLDQRISTARDYNLLPAGSELKQLLAKQPEASWSTQLPATPDYDHHKTFVVPPLKSHGFYVIFASDRPGFEQGRARVAGMPLLLSDIVLTSLVRPDGALSVLASSGRTGEALAGVEVDLFRYDWRRGHQRVRTLRTDRAGLVLFPAQGRGHSHFLVGRRGEERALDARYLSLHSQEEPKEARAAFVYTDRSVYRPTQKLLWKVVAYQGGKGDVPRFATLPGQRLTVALHDPNGEKVAERKVKTNGFGSASGEFVIPTGRLLGQWSVRSSIRGVASVRVEEYKRPTFEVSLEAPSTPMRLNRPASLGGEARYYFGSPVTSGSARWRVERTPVFPRWWAGWYGSMPASPAQVIATGQSKLGDDGAFAVKFTPEADERRAKQGVTFRYRISVDVTDEGGETRSAERTLRLGFVAVEARIDGELAFADEHRASKWRVVRTDLNGAPLAGPGRYRVTTLAQPSEPLLPAEEPLPAPAEGGSVARVVTPGDRLRSRATPGYDPNATMKRWADGARVTEGTLTHDAQGLAVLKLPPLAAGAYRIRYETTDAFGAKFETSKELVVAGARTPLALPALLQLQRAATPVGEKVRVLVHSGIRGQRLVLDIAHANRRYERRFLVAGVDPSVIELPIQEVHRGGVRFALSTLRDHQAMTASEALFVPFDDRKLQLSFSSFRDTLRPGAKETWRLTVRGSDGKTAVAAAELLAYMYDQSLELFAPHAPPLVETLYPQRMPWLNLQTNLSVARVGWVATPRADLPDFPTFSEDQLRLFGGYGVGGPGRRMLHLKYPATPMMAKRQSALAGDSRTEALASGETRELSQASSQLPDASAITERPAAPEVALRSDFAETAFWRPHLVADAKGAVSFEFTVPDSVTAWSVWVHALTRDLRGGSEQRTVRSVKELMVRPYVPRFLREGDVATLNVVVNNASERELSGEVSFELVDAQTQEPLNRLFQVEGSSAPFAVAPGKSATVGFALTAPRELRTVAVKVVATAGQLSDGELRPLPLLPGRVHLMQSRFVTLRGKDQRTLEFPELARADEPTRQSEQLIVTVDAQLFYTVLQSLPYLVNYPYECTEQTLNRFVSTGVVTSVFRDYPAVARMAKRLGERRTRLETFDSADPNRKLAMEETPWLVTARGGGEEAAGLANVLDPRSAAAERDASLAKLKSAQTSMGAFPWFPGGAPSPYMTLYLLHGFARAAELGVEVPRDVVARAWGYIAQHFREEYAKKMLEDDCCWEFLTFLNYVASSYPDESYLGGALSSEERRSILDHSFKHWRRHSPYLKGYLALTLERMGRAADARKVFDSVMDSSRTTRDEGTFWAPEDRGWLWYNDQIETHAFALRTLMALAPEDPRRDGLVQWLLLNKKLNQWKSTRATAEVIYALIKYLEKERALGVREDAQLTVNGRTTSFVFDPDEFSGKKNQRVIPAEEISARTSKIVVRKSSPGFAFASATWHFSTERAPTGSQGDLLGVSRTYFRRVKTAQGPVLKPLRPGEPLAVGDELEVQLSLRAKAPAEFIHLRDPRAAGLEPENAVSRHKWELGIAWYEEVRDSGTNFFFEQLPQGEYTFKYRLRANMAGTFKVSPATVQSMYAPEFTAYSAGATLGVEPARE